MSLPWLYKRVLELLGKESRLGWILAGANLLIAGSQFAEPVLFGRIVDVLSINPSSTAPGSSSAWPLLAAWAAFGLFTIVASAAIALHADRLAHRQRQVVLTNYFEHIMQLPLSYHTGAHSGRLMKVMLNGTDSLWRLWLGFFREHFAAIMSLIVLLPLALYINWRLATLLFVLCVVFTVITMLVVRKTYGMQSEVEAHFTDLSARALDALGNVALCRASCGSTPRFGACASSPTTCLPCRCRCCPGGLWSPSSRGHRPRSRCWRSSPLASRCMSGALQASARS
jgi:ATP-binding cassette subfamily B protein